MHSDAQQIMYYFLCGAGAVIAAAYFLLHMIKNNTGWKRIAIAVIVSAASLAAAALTVRALKPLLYEDVMQATAVVIPEYYLTVVFMSVYFVCGSLIVNAPPESRAAFAYAVIIFSFISRIGCCVAGCCGGRSINGVVLPMPYIELAVAAALFILPNIFKVKRPLTVYLLLYSIFRFAAEFLRENSNISTYSGLNIRQIVALPVIAVTIVMLLRQLHLKEAKYAQTDH